MTRLVAMTRYTGFPESALVRRALATGRALEEHQYAGLDAPFRRDRNCDIIRGGCHRPA